MYLTFGMSKPFWNKTERMPCFIRVALLLVNIKFFIINQEKIYAELERNSVQKP